MSFEVDPRQTLIMMGGSRGYAPIIACAIISLMETQGDDWWFSKIIVNHTGFSKRDIEILEKIGPVHLNRFRFPWWKFPALAGSRSVAHFSTIVLSKFEVFEYLEKGFSCAVWLDADVQIQKPLRNLANFHQKDVAGKFLVGRNANTDQFFVRPQHMLQARALSTGVFSVTSEFSKRLPHTRDELYKIGNKFFANLKMPEQAILEIFVQTHSVKWEPLSMGEFAAHPRSANSEAKIVHSYNDPKFWDDPMDLAWKMRYEEWLSMGGSELSVRRLARYRLIRKLVASAMVFGLIRKDFGH